MKERKVLSRNPDGWGRYKYWGIKEPACQDGRNSDQPCWEEKEGKSRKGGFWRGPLTALESQWPGG